MKSFLSKEVKEHFTRKSKEYSTYGHIKHPKISIPKNKRVLEVGCGAKFTFELAPEKYAVDITPALLKALKKQNPDANLIISDARYLPFRDDVFHCVAAVWLLHHLVGVNTRASRANIELSLAEFKRTTEKNGVMYILEHLTKNRLFSLFFFYVSLVCAKLNLNIDYFDIHDKVITYFLDEKSFKRLVCKLKLKTETVSNLRWSFHKINLGQNKELILRQ